MADVPVLFGKPIPETQLSAPHPTFTHPVTGSIIITSGFMEPKGHGFKSTARRAIFANGSIRTSNPGNYNIGIDYTKGFGSNVTCWYSGVVVKAGFEGGYGHRIHVRLDLPFQFEGRSHVCFQAYAHCSRLLRGVGQRVSQGEAVAIEAGHGSSGPNDYPSHVDLDTYCVIDGETLHINPDLLARTLNPDDVILPVGVLREGAKGDAVRWLQLRLSIKVDGDFGPDTRKAVEAFQRTQADLSVDGVAGENTCTRLGLVEYAIFCRKATTAVSGLTIPAEDSFAFNPVDPPRPLFANWVQDEENHWKFELKQKIQNRFNWFLPKKDVSIVRGYSTTIEDRGDDVSLGDLASPELAEVADAARGRWDLALEVCPTNGCLIATAEPEGLAVGGVASSHEIMERDLVHLTPQRLENLRRAGARLKVPVEVIVALASRESHLGAILGKFGNDPGWGDGNHAWGILQVDRRFHSIQGLDDPFSQAHVEQASGIFASFRDQVQRIHPDWADEFVLKGACVAYNSGPDNVQTIAGMNQGTAHNDYGDDVIARAQFCRGKV
jgi:peptidoglycan hydrolase-like protein with peptidoglycan-binding domain